MTVFHRFRRTADEYGSRPFLHIPAQAAARYAASPIDLTYGEALAEIERLRGVYAAAGYGHGHRIALVLENRAEFFTHFLALNALGAGIVPVNAGFLPAEMAYVIGHSDAVLAVSLPEHVAAVADAASSAPVVAVDALVRLPAAPPAPNPDPPGPATEAAMLYTSGTTDRPKGCMLSNEYFEMMGEWYARLGGYCELRPGRERLLTPLPLVHMNALCCSSMGMIATGGCIVQLDRFHASNWWQTVRDSRATALHYLGVMPAILLNLPESPGDDIGDQIRFGFGAGVDPRHQERFEARFGFPLIEGWAMTETGAAGCIMANREPRHVGTRCFGKPLPHLATRVIDEAGNEVSEGAPGELLVRHSGADPRRGFFSGYYKDPQATEEAWTGGWFHTGDVVRKGPDGSFHFVDRKKNVIRRSGENIAAVEVEGILFQAPGVENCAVAPVPDDIRGEEVMACVILKDGAPGSLERARAIFDFCIERMVYYKVPGYIAFVPQLPKTSTEKIQRGELKKLCRDLLEQSRCFDFRDRKRRQA
jgi:acyl-coenzyme A synthetase/AMP-(fatty) acid ligase